MKIAERVAQLTEEEKVKHKELIDECFKREEILEENSKLNEKNLKFLKDSEYGMIGEALWLLVTNTNSTVGKS